MEGAFFQGAALAIITALLCAVLKKQDGVFAAALSALCAGILFLFAFRFLEPVVDFAGKLQAIGGIDRTLSGVLLKSVGIGLITELSVAICEDAGEGSLGKMARFCGSAAAVYLALPLLGGVLDLLEELLNKGV